MWKFLSQSARRCQDVCEAPGVLGTNSNGWTPRISKNGESTRWVGSVNPGGHLRFPGSVKWRILTTDFRKTSSLLRLHCCGHDHSDVLRSNFEGATSSFHATFSLTTSFVSLSWGGKRGGPTHGSRTSKSRNKVSRWWKFHVHVSRKFTKQNIHSSRILISYFHWSRKLKTLNPVSRKNPLHRLYHGSRGPILNIFVIHLKIQVHNEI